MAKYFCGYLPFDHFELEEDKLEQKLIEKEASSNIGRLDETMDILKEFLPSSEVATSKEELEIIQKEIEEELKSLSEKQILLFDKQINLENDIHELEQQHLIASAAINDLDKDYNFAVENVIEDLLTCPLCGTDHDNSLLSRAGILSDKDSLEDQKIKIEYDLIEKYETRKEIADNLKIVSDEIDRINYKYLREEDSDLKIFDQVIHSISQKKVNEKIISRKEIFQVEIQNSKDQQKNIAKEQKGLLSKERKEELNSYFLGNLVESIKSIAATGVNLDGVKTPMDYNKILGGGAAEGTRGVLAYQLAILKQIDYAASCQISPFIIDTPNQQEQAKHRYDKVIDVVVDSVPKGYQIILCAMENKALDNYKKDAHVIRLDEDKLLKKEKYKELSKEYDEIILKV